MSQRVIITAAAAGIGSSIVEAFTRSGAQIELCDVDEAALAAARAKFPSAVCTRVDLRSVGELDAWLDGAIERLGGVDVLINNAGIKGPTANVEDVTHDEWDECLSICLDSHFACVRRIAPLLKEQGGGVILNMSSMAGMVGYGMRTPYAAAKWAVVGLTKSLAIELGPYNVRCNCICPGSVRGDRMNRAIEAEAAQRGIAGEAVAADYLAGQSIKRFVDPGEIADLCVFLASPAAAMISGQAIALDGHTETYRLS
jgi:NAD(P)-dependent dehydrogenase (short-subunit alcohol dehydrogenase family)